MPNWLRYALVISLFGLLFYAGLQHWPFANLFMLKFNGWLAAAGPWEAGRATLRGLLWEKVPVLGQEVGHYAYALGFAPLLAALVCLVRRQGWRAWVGWSTGFYLFYVLGSGFLVLIVGRLLGQPLADAVPEFASAFFSPLPLGLVLLYFRLVRLLRQANEK